MMRAGGAMRGAHAVAEQDDDVLRDRAVAVDADDLEVAGSR